jgi:hypothetical protein
MGYSLFVGWAQAIPPKPKPTREAPMTATEKRQELDATRGNRRVAATLAIHRQ